VPETTFEVVFDGPGLGDGRMPVRDFAPALLALGELFVDASSVVHPDQPPAALKIRATEEGSFVIDLVLEAPNAWNQFVNLFNSDGANALVNFRDAVIGGVGLYWLIKQIRGRKITSRDESPKAGYIKITLEDSTILEVPSEVLSLFENLRVRKKARQFVEPVARDGIDRVEFRREQETTVAVEEADLPAYEVPDVEEVPLLDEESEMVVSISSVVFNEGNKWRFTDGERNFSAAIEDESFRERVDKGIESFRSGDMLRCKMRMVQKRRADALQTDYFVVNVEEHIPREVQLRLDGGDDRSATPMAELDAE
jgi:hypothetical protein